MNPPDPISLARLRTMAERAGHLFVPLEIRRNEDGTVDEVVVCGNVHVEQMDTGHWWIGIDPADGRLLHLNLHARGKITLNVEDDSPSDLAVGCDPATLLTLVEAVERLIEDGHREECAITDARFHAPYSNKKGPPACTCILSRFHAAEATGPENREMKDV
jgi:hypothetical protein